MIYKNKSYIYSIQFAFYAKQTLSEILRKGREQLRNGE